MPKLTQKELNTIVEVATNVVTERNKRLDDMANEILVETEKIKNIINDNKE